LGGLDSRLHVKLLPLNRKVCLASARREPAANNSESVIATIATAFGGFNATLPRTMIMMTLLTDRKLRSYYPAPVLSNQMITGKLPAGKLPVLRILRIFKFKDL